MICRNIAKYILTAIPWGEKHTAYIPAIMVCSFLVIIYHFDGSFLFVHFLTINTPELIVLTRQASRQGVRDVI